MRWQVGVPRGPGWDVTPAAAAAAQGNLLKDPKTSSQGAQQHLCAKDCFVGEPKRGKSAWLP